MTVLDWLIVAAYFVVLAGIVWWSARRIKTTADYFLAGREVGFFVVGASIFASNIGSEHIVGLAGSGAANGLAQAHWELHAWVLVLLAWVFVPFYYRSGVFTMPEFLERRFNSRARWILAVVSLTAYVFTKVSVTVYAGALVFRTLLADVFSSPDEAFWVGAIVTVLATGVYTVLGGLRAVVYTEVLQTGLLILGSVLITVFGLSALGGWEELREVARLQGERWALWRSNADVNFPWLGVMISSVVTGIWYWCTDQYIVQRTLAARSLEDARRGALWGGFLKVWPVFIFLVPGMIGYALHVKGVIRIPTDALGQLQGDMVFPTLVAELLPLGLRGLVVGGLLSALMSSLSSLFNSCATLFTVDIYEKLRPGRPEAELVRVGRIATAVVVGLGLLWIPIMKVMAESKAGLYDYLQNVQGFLAPPITAVFVLGLLSRRVNARAAVWALGVGFVLALLKLTLQSMVQSGALEATSLLGAIGAFNGYYFSGLLFLLSVGLLLGVSLATEPPPLEKIQGLTFGTVSRQDRADSRRTWDWRDVLLTIIVLGLVLAIYLYFSFWV
jgi:SSS family solute:Na+ symporter